MNGTYDGLVAGRIGVERVEGDGSLQVQEEPVQVSGQRVCVKYVLAESQIQLPLRVDAIVGVHRQSAVTLDPANVRSGGEAIHNCSSIGVYVFIIPPSYFIYDHTMLTGILVVLALDGLI